jgi:uncharacterized protein DUF4381
MIQSVDDLLSQLRPITGPEAAPPAEPASFAWIWALIAFALVAFLAAIMIRRYRRRPVPRADQEALAALNRLPDTPTHASLAELDRLIRRYLERTFFIATEHMTSSELLMVLPDDASSEWSAIFEQLQPGRFSRRPVTREEWSSLIEQVRPLIRIVHADLAGPVVQSS